MKCIADLEHVESKEDAPWTSYYQWVTFVQLFQVGLAGMLDLSHCVQGTTKRPLHPRLCESEVRKIAVSASFAGRKTQIVTMIQASWDPVEGLFSGALWF